MYRRQAQMPDIDPQSYGGMFYDPYSPGLNAGLGLRNLAEYHFKMKEAMRQQKLQEEMERRKMELYERQENRLGQPPPQVDPGPLSSEGKAISDIMKQFEVDANKAVEIYRGMKASGRSVEDEGKIAEARAAANAKYREPKEPPRPSEKDKALAWNLERFNASAKTEEDLQEYLENERRIHLGQDRAAGTDYMEMGRMLGIGQPQEETPKRRGPFGILPPKAQEPAPVPEAPQAKPTADQDGWFVNEAVKSGLASDPEQAAELLGELRAMWPNVKNTRALLALAKKELEKIMKQ